MKKLFLLMAFAMMTALSIVLASCESSSNDEENEVSIVGTWEVTFIESSTSYEFVGEEVKVGDKVYFYPDGRYENPIETGRWSKDGNLLTIILDVDEYDERIILNIPSVMRITKLTDKVLELKLDYGNVVQIVIKMKRVSS